LAFTSQRFDFPLISTIFFELMKETPKRGKTIPSPKAPKMGLEARTYWEQITKKIRAVSEFKGFSQGQLALLSGLKRSFLNRILKNPSNLTLETIGQLEKALRVKLIEVSEFKPPQTMASGTSASGTLSKFGEEIIE
jgi:ribosome-binding protein aMBF1 (putative translation factor)